MNVNRSGNDAAASTIARFVLPVSVTTAALCDVVRQRLQDLEILLNRRGENDEIGVGEDHRIVRSDIDRVENHRPLEDILLIHADDERGGPGLARRERNRSADQSQTNDADALEDRRLPLVAAGLQHRQLSARPWNWNRNPEPPAHSPTVPNRA